MKFWPILITALIAGFPVHAKESEKPCEQELFAVEIESWDVLPEDQKQESAELAERIILKLQRAGVYAKQGQFDRAFLELDDVDFFAEHGWTLVPYSRRVVVNYTPQSFEDLHRKLQELHKRRNAPRVNVTDKLISTWVVVPEDDPSAEAWKIVWTDRLLEMAEEIGHLAQFLREHGTGRWNISQYFNNPENVWKLKKDRWPATGPGIRLPRGEFIEADIYAFLLETFGPKFVPQSYAANSWEARRFADADLRRLDALPEGYAEPKFAELKWKPNMSRDQAKTLAERILAKLKDGAELARRGEFEKAFAEIDDEYLLRLAGIQLQPFHERFVLNYTPTSAEDLQKKIDETIRTLGQSPTANVAKGLVTSWVVLPEFDASPDVWKIIWTDRILELTEEIGHVAQILYEYGTGRWHISRFMNDPANVHQVRMVNWPWPLDHTLPRTDFVEADIYAFILELFGADFVPKSYAMPFWEVRQFADHHFRRGSRPADKH